MLASRVVRRTFWHTDYHALTGTGQQNAICVDKIWLSVFFVDFIPFGSNKGTALKFILEKMNLTPAEAICFGDQQNDIEMLEYTETSYAMAHAKPEIHKHATDITESVEKTLRELLKTYF